MKEIALTRGMVALVDDQDFEALGHKWYANRNGRRFYAVRMVPREGGGRRMEYLHRLVLARVLGRELVRGEDTDHVNGDGLDNRRENLRVATRAQNMRNCRRYMANPSSRYLGVCWCKEISKWQARVGVNGKAINLGYHATELQAAQAREAYIDMHPELNARSNFPKETPWTQP